MVVVGKAMQLCTSLYAVIAAIPPWQPYAQDEDGVVVPVGQAVNAH
jgi:hypothetical protein